MLARDRVDPPKATVTKPKARVRKPKPSSGPSESRTAAAVGKAVKRDAPKVTVRKPSGPDESRTAATVGKGRRREAPPEADRKAGTQAQRKAIRVSYDKLPLAEKKRILAALEPGTVVGDTILSTHQDRVRGSRLDAITRDALAEKEKDATKKGGTRLATILGASLDAVIAPAAAVGSRVLPGVLRDTSDKSLEIARNAAREAVDIPLNTPGSLYHLADTARRDPVKAGEMLAQPYIDLAKDPVKTVTNQPLSSVLMVSGVKGGVGRSAGAAMRKAPSKRIRRAASTQREPATVPGTELAQVRKYSPDVTKKAAQVAAERRRIRKATKKGTASPAIMQPHEIRRRVDEHVAASEDIRRENRTATVNAANAAVTDAKPGKRIRRAGSKPTAGTTLAVQGVARNVPELRSYLDRLVNEAAKLEGTKLRANRTAQSEVRAAIKAGGGFTRAADRYTQEISIPLQRKLAARGLVDREQAERARAIPYAVTRMGARHLTREQVKQLLTDARAAHKAATKDLADAENAVTAASREVARSQGRAAILSRNVGGSAAERAAERRRTPEYQGGGTGVAKSRAALATTQTRAMAARDALAAAQRKLAAAETLKRNGGALVTHDGKPLTTDAIRAHMEANGVPEPGYVTNAPNQRGARNFYVPTHEPPKVPSTRRTGKAIAEGTTDLDPDVLVEGAARTQGLVDAAERYGAFLKEFAVRGKTGKVRQFGSYKQARAAAEALIVDKNGDPLPDAVPMRAVQINPFTGKAEQLRATMEHADRDATTNAARDAVQSALADEAHATGPWTLVPDIAADQMRQHIRVTGQGVPGKTANLIGSRFRQTVLATNPKWLVGNVVEAAARALVAGAGPGSYAIGRGALRRLDDMDPKAAQEARSRMTGGGHMTMDRRVQTYSAADQFAGTRLAGVATALGKFWRTPGPKQLADVWHGYTDLVFHTINGRIETQVQTAMLGKALKGSALMSEHTVKVSKQAMDEAARGLRDTNAQAALGREVDRMFGAYGKFSPERRHLIAGYTPFVAWAVNATTFLTRVLPRDHPVLTSVLASANVATEEWRKDRGLKFGEQDAPYYLQGSVPVGSGKLRVAKYTPFGVMASPSGAAGTVADSLLPQFESVLLNLKGKDWKGNDLEEGKSPILEATVSLIEGTVPLVGQASRIAKNPGDTTAKLRKELDPTYAVPSSQKERERRIKLRKRKPGDLYLDLPSLPELPTLPELPQLPTLPRLP